MGWFYLSFATPAEFLGAVIVQGHDVISADEEATRLGITPEFPPLGTFDGNYAAVQGAPWPGSVSAEFCNRLLTKDDVMRLGGGNSN